MENDYFSNFKIALVHDWFITVGGAEKVVSQLLELFPHADVFCLLDFLEGDDRESILKGRTTQVSYLQRLPFVKKNYRKMIPFFYKAIETLNVKDYDLIISSSHAVAKGIVIKFIFVIVILRFDMPGICVKLI